MILRNYTKKKRFTLYRKGFVYKIKTGGGRGGVKITENATTLLYNYFCSCSSSFFFFGGGGVFFSYTSKYKRNVEAVLPFLPAKKTLVFKLLKTVLLLLFL